MSADAQNHPVAGAPDRQRYPLARGIEILTLMIDGGGHAYGVRELGKRLGVSASTAHRLLGDLESLGMVARNPAGNYQLGMEFLRLAWTASTRFPLREAARDVLEELTERSGESSFFAIYNDQRRQLMFALSVESAHPLRYTVPQGVWLPLHAGASGLAILAFLPPDVQAEIVRGVLDALTERTLVDSGRLAERLARIRQDGYAISHGERITGAIAIAAPVLGPADTVIGDVGITIPETRFNAASAAEFAAAVQQSAELLTRRFTGSRADQPDQPVQPGQRVQPDLPVQDGVRLYRTSILFYDKTGSSRTCGVSSSLAPWLLEQDIMVRWPASTQQRIQPHFALATFRSVKCSKKLTDDRRPRPGFARPQGGSSARRCCTDLAWQSSRPNHVSPSSH
jgi:DNA-binding IclR family transcriptional regulator